MEFHKTICIEAFYQELVKDKSVQEELLNELGSEIANKIIKLFNEGMSHEDIDEDFEDLIINHVENNADTEDTLIGLGSHGEFPIDIMNYGPIYWVSAQEFDPIKYFKTFDDAKSCAEFEYETFLYGDKD